MMKTYFQQSIIRIKYCIYNSKIFYLCYINLNIIKEMSIIKVLRILINQLYFKEIKYNVLNIKI